MAEKLMTPLFRASYAHLLKPKLRKDAKEGDTPKYSVLIPIKKTSKEGKIFLAKLEKAMLAASLEKHGKAIPKNKLKHWPIRDGDEENEDGEVDPNHAGHWCINASSRRKPQVINKKGDVLLDEEEVYSGMWCRATIAAWAWDNPTGGKGVSIDLHNLIKMKDDEKLGGGAAPATSDFEDLISDDEDDDLL